MAGITGVAVLLAPVEGFGELDPLGVGLVLVAEIAWASGSIYARYAPLPRSGLLLTGMEMVAGGAALLLTGTLLGELGQADVGTFSLRSLLAVGYLIVFGSIVAFTAYTWLLANTSVAIVGTHAYVNPVVAVALGAILLSEPITPRTVMASVIIVAAVAAMASGRPQAVEDAAPDPGPPHARLRRTAPSVRATLRDDVRGMSVRTRPQPAAGRLPDWPPLGTDRAPPASQVSWRRITPSRPTSTRSCWALPRGGSTAPW